MKLSEFKPQHINEYQLSSSSTAPVHNARGIYPLDYLDFAKLDIAVDRDRRALINSIGNAKRAFHLQVDIIADAFGWGEWRGGRQTGFPEKLNFLAKCGVISPNILRKLNSTRNKVEHDYVIPRGEEVDDYVDIVELFLMATKTFVDGFPDMIELDLIEDESRDPLLELPEFIRVKIESHEGSLVLSAEGESRAFDLKDQFYFEWLSATIRSYLG